MWFRWKMNSVWILCEWDVEKLDFLLRNPRLSNREGITIQKVMRESNILVICVWRYVLSIWQTIHCLWYKMDNKMVIASHWKRLVIPCEKGLVLYKTENGNCVEMCVVWILLFICFASAAVALLSFSFFHSKKTKVKKKLKARMSGFVIEATRGKSICEKCRFTCCQVLTQTQLNEMRAVSNSS